MKLAERVEQEMGEAVFSSHGESLEEVVLLMLGLRHMTLAAAESCTGGLLAQRLTAVPGSSRYFLGGAVVYADRLKTIFADVPEETGADRGAGERAGGAGDGRRDSAGGPARRLGWRLRGLPGRGRALRDRMRRSRLGWSMWRSRLRTMVG